ncbi:MAG TPA: DUF72 domain-containing protein [Gaiellaceae bacterium]|nr:DUF72 domain-containing protein [Gaiellaceae bacterium]
MIRIGTSGWSYPSWRGGFYPDGMKPAEFLGFYSERFDTVELNSTGYRLPSEDQFRRWAEAVPDGFRFAVKLPLGRLDRVTPFLERVLALGDRLGPVRVVVEAARDDGLVSFVQGSVPGDVELAWDFRHESWAGGGEGIVRVGDPGAEPFRYLRLREPPYSDDELAEAATGVRDPAYVYLRHEDEPTAPAYAQKLRAFVGQ